MESQPYDVPGSGPAEAPPCNGLVVDEGRGSLPYHVIHGEALVAAAAWAMTEAGVDLVDFTVSWEDIAGQDQPLVLHDPLCPMTPPEFIAGCVWTAVERDAVVVGVRPVTDTVKQVVDGSLGATVDRDGLAAVCSPIVLPARVVDELSGLPATDFVELVTALRASYDVVLVDAPPAARRVAGEADLAVLAALTDPR